MYWCMWRGVAAHHRCPGCCTALLDALADAVVDAVQDFSPQGLANVIWGYAALGYHEVPVMLDAVAGAVVRSAQHFNAQEISNAVFGLGKLQPMLRGSCAGSAGGCVLEAAIVSVLPRLGPKASSGGGLTPQNLANLAWGAARVVLYHEGATLGSSISFGDVFTALIAEQAPDCNARELTMLINACVNASDSGSRHASFEPAMRAIGRAVLDLLQRGDATAVSGAARGALQPGQLVTVAHGFARLRLVPAPALLRAVSRASKTQLAVFSWHDLAQLTWSYARLQCRKPKLMAKIGREVCRRLRKQRRGVTAITAAGGNPSYPDALSQGSSQRDDTLDHAHQLSRCDGGDGDAASPRHLATLIWSFATLGFRDEKVASAIARAGCAQLASFSPRDIANASWGYATLGAISVSSAQTQKKGRSGESACKSSLRFMMALRREGAERLGEFTAQECSQFLWAVDKAGLSRTDPVLSKAASLRRLRTFQFPALASEVTIEWQPAGRGLSHTGTAPWDAAYVLAEWISRHQSPAAVPALRPLLRGGQSRGQGQGVEEVGPGGGGGDSGAWQSWGGRWGVELGAGVGLLSVSTF
jgi:hypothetical protein